MIYVIIHDPVKKSVSRRDPWPANDLRLLVLRTGLPDGPAPPLSCRALSDRNASSAAANRLSFSSSTALTVRRSMFVNLSCRIDTSSSTSICDRFASHFQINNVIDVRNYGVLSPEVSAATGAVGSEHSIELSTRLN